MNLALAAAAPAGKAATSVSLSATTA